MSDANPFNCPWMHWAFDFELSFGDPSPGRSSRCILDPSGKRLLGSSIWTAADDAIRLIRATLPPGDWGTPPVAVRDALPLLSEFVCDFLAGGVYPVLKEAISAGKVDAQGMPPGTDFQTMWKEYGLIERAKIFLELVEQHPPALTGDDLEWYVQHIAAVCVLISANDAAIAHCLDGSGLDESAADVAWLHRHLTLQGHLSNLITKVKRKTLTERATDMATRRHADTNSARDWVRSEWHAYRDAYQGNKSAFARDYVRRVFNERGVQVTEKQMREVWLKDPPPAGKQAGMQVGR